MTRYSARQEEIDNDQAEINLLQRHRRLRLVLDIDDDDLDVWSTSTIHRLENRVYPRYYQREQKYRNNSENRKTIVSRLLETDLMTDEEFLETFRLSKAIFKKLHQFLYSGQPEARCSRLASTELQLLAFLAFLGSNGNGAVPSRMCRILCISKGP
jgi:hypothetical protein